MLFSIVAAAFNIPTSSVGGKHMFDCHTWGWEKLRESLGWKLRMQLDILQCTAQPLSKASSCPKCQHAMVENQPPAYMMLHFSVLST